MTSDGLNDSVGTAQFQISYHAHAFAKAVERNFACNNWRPEFIFQIMQLRDKMLAVLHYGGLKYAPLKMLEDMESHWKELDDKVKDKPDTDKFLGPVLAMEAYNDLIGINSIARGDSTDQFGSPVDTRGYPPERKEKNGT